ncbi:MAG: type II toxin-antitoxin system PemK/MazF family toxin [Thermoplasmatota archaeon]
MTPRGAIVWANLGPTVGHEQAGRRPVLVVSRTHFNKASGTVIAFPLTSQPQRLGYPVTALLPDGILAKPTWVKLTQVRTVSAERLGALLGQAPDAFVRHCVLGLAQHCGL